MSKLPLNTAGSCAVCWAQRILGKGFIVSYSQVCLKSRNMPVRYKIYRDSWFINCNLLILQESLAYNFVSTAHEVWSWFGWFLLRTNPEYRPTSFSAKWSFIILNLVCIQTYRKLGLYCNRFVFPKIKKKKKYSPLSVNMGLMLSLLYSAPVLCLLFLGERCYVLIGLC